MEDLERREAAILTEETIRGAINKLLEDSMIFNGYIEIGNMTRTDIDYAVHLLRRYRATKFGEPLRIIS